MTSLAREDGIVIEWSRASDAEAVYRLSASLGVLDMGHEDFVFAWRNGAENGRRMGGCFLVARDGDQVVGYIQGQSRMGPNPGVPPGLWWAGFFSVDQVAVREDYQRRGIGRDMLKMLSALADGHGCIGLVAMVEPVENEWWRNDGWIVSADDSVLAWIIPAGKMQMSDPQSDGAWAYRPLYGHQFEVPVFHYPFGWNNQAVSRLAFYRNAIQFEQTHRAEIATYSPEVTREFERLMAQAHAAVKGG